MQVLRFICMIFNLTVFSTFFSTFVLEFQFPERERALVCLDSLDFLMYRLFPYLVIDELALLIHVWYAFSVWIVTSKYRVKVRLCNTCSFVASMIITRSLW